jgi:hypothetical protein
MHGFLDGLRPRRESDADGVLDLAIDHVLAHGLRVDHPRFFA